MNCTEEFDRIKNKYERLKEVYFSEKGKADQLIARKESLKKELAEASEYVDTLEKVRILLQRVSEYSREQSKNQVESLVTDCLQSIFDSDIKFHIELNEVRGRTEAEFYVISRCDGEEVRTRPQEARGGGVVDIISLALRVAMLQCSNLDAGGPIILDEPAKHLSDEYIVQVGEFLRQVSAMFDRQIIMVTHNRHLSELADKGFRVEMNHGKSLIFDS